MTKVALRQQQQYRASVSSWQGVSTNVIRDTKLLRPTTHRLYSTLKVRESEQLYAQQPLEPEDSDGWQTCGVESAQGHAGSSNISETLAGTLVE